MGVSILICGDVCPTASNRELFESGNTERLFGNLLPEFLNLKNRISITLPKNILSFLKRIFRTFNIFI